MPVLRCIFVLQCQLQRVTDNVDLSSIIGDIRLYLTTSDVDENSQIEPFKSASNHNPGLTSVTYVYTVMSRESGSRLQK